MNSLKARSLIGAFLILIGALFIIDNFNLLSFDLTDIFFSWEIIIIVIGAVILLNDRGNFMGFVLIIVGLIFILSDIYYFDVSDLFFKYWPILLIILGISILLKKHDGNKHAEKGTAQSQMLSDENVIDETTIFSHKKKFLTTKQFKGGKITTIFGGAEIDLVDAELADGEHLLDVVAIFGGVNLTVPSHMRIVPKLNSIFGGFDDKRRNIDTSDNQTNKVLIIKGIAIFGGGEIKN